MNDRAFNGKRQGIRISKIYFCTENGMVQVYGPVDQNKERRTMDRGGSADNGMAEACQRMVDRALYLVKGHHEEWRRERKE
jgi:hypothetical protein